MRYEIGRDDEDHADGLPFLVADRETHRIIARTGELSLDDMRTLVRLANIGFAAIQRREGESQIDYEDRVMPLLMLRPICGERTSNGAPWAMPCTRKQGHAEACYFDCPNWEFVVEQIG